MAKPRDICVYCAQPVLTGEERPEHAIPAALGASLCVDAVCDPCNAWAGREVDQPFLEDAWVCEHRSQSRVIDPRRGRKAQPVRSPLLQGVTEDGDFIFIGRDGRPKMRPRIIELGAGRFEIRANSAEEARRLQRRVERRAEAAGKTARLESVTAVSSRPRLHGQISISPVAWQRMAAKIGLAVGSQVYPHAWRTGSDSALLREWLNGKGASASGGGAQGLIPRQVPGTPFERLVVGIEHLLFFMHHQGATHLVIVLFGSVLISVPIDTSGSVMPQVAWKLDPKRPRTTGATTWDALLAEAAQRFIVEEANQVSG